MTRYFVLRCPFRNGVIAIFTWTLITITAPFSAGAVDSQLSGFQYLQQRNYPKALECFNAALKEHPGSWQTMQNIGSCQMELGHYDRAIASFQKSIEVGGLHASQCVNLAAVYQRSGQPKQALNWLKLACSIDPASSNRPCIVDRFIHMSAQAAYLCIS